jgi:hypothetical protein
VRIGNTTVSQWTGQSSRQQALDPQILSLLNSLFKTSVVKTGTWSRISNWIRVAKEVLSAQQAFVRRAANGCYPPILTNFRGSSIAHKRGRCRPEKQKAPAIEPGLLFVPRGQRGQRYSGFLGNIFGGLKLVKQSFHPSHGLIEITAFQYFCRGFRAIAGQKEFNQSLLDRLRALIRTQFAELLWQACHLVSLLLRSGALYFQDQ